MASYKKILLFGFLGISLGTGSFSRKVLAEGHGGGGHESAGAEAGVPFLSLTPIMIPVLQKDAVMAYVQLKITLELLNAADRAVMEEKLPHIRDAIFRDLYGVLGALWLPGNDLDPKFLKSRIAKILKETMGTEMVRSVLLEKMDVHAAKKP